MAIHIRRRECILTLGGAAVWPLAGRAQQAGIPLIGYLGIRSLESDAFRLTGLRRGLNETGYVEGRNVAIEYRWEENQPDRIAALVAELVQMRVAVIVTVGAPATLAAKAATTTIPILFNSGADPVQLGFVASLNRPSGNLTGFNQFSAELGAKTVALLHRLVPSTPTIGVLGNPNNSMVDGLVTRDVLAAPLPSGYGFKSWKLPPIAK